MVLKLSGLRKCSVTKNAVVGAEKVPSRPMRHGEGGISGQEAVYAGNGVK